MAYVQGGDIMASDYNAMLNSVLNIYGAGGTSNGEADGTFGYGQSVLSLNPVSPGDTVRSTEWVNLRNMIALIAQHQGTNVTLPTVAQLATDSPILAHPPAPGDLPGSIQAIRNNRLNAALTSTTLVQNATNVSISTPWTEKVQFAFDVKFANANQARYFYNTGGQIRIRAAMSGGSATTEVQAWKNLLSDSGAVQFKAFETTSTNTSNKINQGYYTLQTYTGGGSTIWEKGSVAGAMSFKWSIYAGKLNEVNTNGGNGTGDRFTVEFWNVLNPNAVSIDSKIDVYVDYLIATNPFTVIGPTISINGTDGGMG